MEEKNTHRERKKERLFKKKEREREAEKMRGEPKRGRGRGGQAGGERERAEKEKEREFKEITFRFRDALSGPLTGCHSVPGSEGEGRLALIGVIHLSIRLTGGP